MRKILILILILTCLFVPVLSSCGTDSDIPSGMQEATCLGANYRLYVPANWTVNTNSGISSAFFTQGEYAMVTVTEFDSGEETIAERAAKAQEAYCSLYQDFKKVSEQDTKLGGADAKAFVFTFTYGETKCRCLELISAKAGKTVSMLFLFTEENYEGFADNRDSIIGNFRFAAPYEGEAKHKIPEGVVPPAGMKLASFDEGSYRLFVPETWQLRTQNGLTLAYVSESDRSNISMMAYMPEQDSMSLAEYWELCKKDYARDLLDFQVLDAETKIYNSETDTDWDLRMSGRLADKAVFTASIDGVTYKYCQYFCAYASMIYVLTYTSTEALFDSHLNELEKVLENVVLGY